MANTFLPILEHTRVHDTRHGWAKMLGRRIQVFWLSTTSRSTRSSDSPLKTKLGQVVGRRTRSFHASITASQHRPSDPSLVDITHAPVDFDVSSAVVYRDLVSPEQGQALVDDLLQAFQRKRYEQGHWDAVIVKYKEIELGIPEESTPQQQTQHTLSQVSRQTVQSIRQHLQDQHVTSHTTQGTAETATGATGATGVWLPFHAIDLHPRGELKAHVDSVRFSGNLVAGLSLLSDSIMRLRPYQGDEDKTPDIARSDQYVDLFLPALSLYVLQGSSRYHYTHELLSAEQSVFRGEQVVRGRRLSIIFRDVKG